MHYDEAGTAPGIGQAPGLATASGPPASGMFAACLGSIF